MGFEVIKSMRGLGLGTSIIKQFLDEHKICSKEIRGSMFFIIKNKKRINSAEIYYDAMALNEQKLK